MGNTGKRQGLVERPSVFLLYILSLRFLKHLRGKYQEAVGYMGLKFGEEILGHKYVSNFL